MGPERFVGARWGTSLKVEGHVTSTAWRGTSLGACVSSFADQGYKQPGSQLALPCASRTVRVKSCSERRCVALPVFAPKSCSGTMSLPALKWPRRAWTPRVPGMACPDTSLTLAKVPGTGGPGCPFPQAPQSPVHGK